MYSCIWNEKYFEKGEYTLWSADGAAGRCLETVALRGRFLGACSLAFAHSLAQRSLLKAMMINAGGFFNLLSRNL